MVVLILIGFLGGLVAGISPCILPVLPVIFAAGASAGIEDDDGAGTPEPASESESASASASASASGPVPEPALAAARATGGAPTGAGTTTPMDGAVGTATPMDGAVGTETVPGPPAGGNVAVVPRPRGRAVRSRRPFAVVGGLVLSFAVFTLIGSWLLSLLGLPQDFLRWVGLFVLGVVGLGLIVPAVGDVLERPFARLAGGRQRTDAGGFVLGLSLGLVFVPCAGPVLAAITVVSASHHYGFSSIVLTVAFALGVAVPLLVFAVLGRQLAERMRLVRSRAAVARKVVGAVLVLTALVIGFNLTNGLQRAVPGYTDALQSHIESNASAKLALGQVTGNVASGALATCTPSSPVLQQCGRAPAIAGISHWLNTPGGRPLSLSGLKGKVVLLDFWTYSCINCQRTLPHLEAWNRSYAKDGLVIIGVHTPEFAFEHVRPT